MPKRNGLIRNSDGFTLVETLITAFLFALVFGAGLIVFSSGADSWQVNDVKLRLQQELRKGMDKMKQDLWQGGVSTITNVPADGNWYTTITFKVTNGVSGGTISWPSDSTQFSLTSGQLRKTVGSTTTILAQNIGSFQVRRQASTPSLIDVSLQAQNTTMRGTVISESINFQIQMRN